MYWCLVELTMVVPTSPESIGKLRKARGGPHDLKQGLSFVVSQRMFTTNPLTWNRFFRDYNAKKTMIRIRNDDKKMNIIVMIHRIDR